MYFKPEAKPQIVRLVVLFLTFAAVMTVTAWKAAAHPSASWGTPLDILSALLLIAILAAIGVTAYRLQKIMDYVDPDVTAFPKPSAETALKAWELEAYLMRTPPRPFSAALFEPLYRGVMPRSMYVLLWLLILVSLFVAAASVLLLYTAGEPDRRLDSGPATTVWGEVLSVTPHASRAGRYVEIVYGYECAGEEMKGRSYGDEAGRLAEGVRVKVRCLDADPGLSRIEGMRSIPVDTALLRITLVAVTLLGGLGLPLYFYLRRRWMRKLLQEGVAVDARLLSVRRGGRGMVFVRAAFEQRGERHIRSVVCPPAPLVYDVLHNRLRLDKPVRLLARPERSRYAYLLEPHLSEA